MDFKSQELFPSLTGSSAQPAAIWKKSNLPGLELGVGNSMERLDIPRENLSKQTLGPSISNTCKSLMARKKVSIELSSNKRTGMVTIIIHGSAADVLATKRELLSQLTVQKTVTLNIPSVAKSFVIGKGGSMLKRITARSMTKIVIPKKDQNESKLVEIIISGDDQGVSIACDEIMEIVKKQTSNYREKVTVEQFLHQFLVPTIPAFEAENKVKIHIPPGYDQKDINEDIVIVGELDNVFVAVEKLNTIIKELTQSLGTIAVPLKKAQHRFILGTKGRGKQEIFEKTGCIVIVPDFADASETVTIKGPEHMLSMALQAVLEKANSIIIGTVDCKSIMALSDSQVTLYLRYLFTRGTSIKELESQNDINIYRQSTLPTVLEVHGRSRKELDVGMVQLKDLISSHAKSLYPKIVNIPIELHSYIIGKGGQNISKLKNHPLVGGKLLEIFISSYKDKSNEVGIIVSRKSYTDQLELDASNDEAENLITSITKLIIDDATAAACSRTEEIAVDSRFHGRLIGSGGSVMKEILGSFQNSVKLSFYSSKLGDSGEGRASSSSDKIVARGNEDGVKQVLDKIKSMIDHWLKVENLTSFSNQLSINNEMMTKIFPAFSGSLGELDTASFTWLVRDVRKKIAEKPSLTAEIKNDPYNIYSHRTFHLRLVASSNNLVVFGPKLLIPIAIDIINAMVEKISNTVFMEFSLFDSEFISNEINLSAVVYDGILGRIIGKQGRNIKKLAEKYNVEVKFSKSTALESEKEEFIRSSASLKYGCVSLNGLKGDVEAIHAELTQIFAKEVKNSYQLLFDIPKPAAGYLLGHNDFNVKKLKSKYSVFMKINETEENANVVLEGEKTNCEILKAMIEGKVEEMMNHTSFELHIPFYLHKYLIGPRGETISQIINSFNSEGTIVIDIPRKSSSSVGSDIINISCHKDSRYHAQSKIDDALSLALYPEGERIPVSSLFYNGLESYLVLDSKEFERIAGMNGEKLIGLTRKYSAFIFIEDESADSVKLRVVGESKTNSEKLTQHLLDEKEVIASIDIPPLISQNFRNSSSEFFFLKNLVSKLEKEFHAVFDIDSLLHKSEGKILVRCTARNLSPLQMFFYSKTQRLDDNCFLSHIDIPKEVISHVIGKGGETLKRIRQISAANVEIYADIDNCKEIAVISGPSLESIEVAELEIGKILKNHIAVVDIQKELKDDTLSVSHNGRPQFPPGYGDNYLKHNPKISHSHLGGQSQPTFEGQLADFGLKSTDANNPEDDIRFSTTSTLCEFQSWKTIKGGKVVQADPTARHSKKKKKNKKKQENVTENVQLEQIPV